jgi:hypothetical protein
VGADGAGLAYQWYKNGAAIANATNYSYTVDAKTTSAAGSYSVTVTGACGLSANSNAVNVGVYDQPVITTHPQNTSVTMPEPLTLSIEETDAQNVRWLKNEKLVSEGTAIKLIIPRTTLADAGYYRAVVTNVCGGVTSQLARVTVIDPATLDPRLATNTPLLDAGEVPYGYTIENTFTSVIGNSGIVPVTISGVQVEGADADAFRASIAGLPVTIQPGQSAALTLTFTPAREGQAMAQATITSNAVNGPHIVALQGMGVVRYRIDGRLTFGTVDLRSTTTKCFQVNNTSTRDITIDNVAIGGANAAAFTASTQTPFAVPAGSTKEFCVQFKPGNVGDYSAQFSFRSSTGGDVESAADGTCEIASSVTENGWAAGISAYPNPASAGVTINLGAVEATRVTIVSQQGALIRTISANGKLAHWDGRDASGTAVATGTYTVLIDDLRTRYALAVVIVR